MKKHLDWMFKHQTNSTKKWKQRSRCPDTNKVTAANLPLDSAANSKLRDASNSCLVVPGPPLAPGMMIVTSSPSCCKNERLSVVVATATATEVAPLLEIRSVCTLATVFWLFGVGRLKKTTKIQERRKQQNRKKRTAKVTNRIAKSTSNEREVKLKSQCWDLELPVIE